MKRLTGEGFMNFIVPYY